MPRRRSRKGIEDVQITVSGLPAHVVKEIDRIAAEEDRSRSSVVRRLLRHAVEQTQKLGAGSWRGVSGMRGRFSGAQSMGKSRAHYSGGANCGAARRPGYRYAIKYAIRHAEQARAAYEESLAHLELVSTWEPIERLYGGSWTEPRLADLRVRVRDLVGFHLELYLNAVRTVKLLKGMLGQAVDGAKEKSEQMP
jgi:Arc/MetJ-type ribon-helix-helix transcriptional regulator